MIQRIRVLALPIAGGLLLALAFPPFNLFLLSLIAITPLLLSLKSVGFRAGFGRGYLFGLVFGLVNLFWLHQFVARWTNSTFMGLIPYLIVCVLFAIYFGLFGGAAAIAWNRKWFWTIPLLWAGVEFARSIVPYIFFPWSQLATACYHFPLILQPAWWGGVYFLGAWMLLLNIIFALIFQGESPIKVRPYLAISLAILALSILSYLAEPKGETRALVAAQPGVDMAFGDEFTRETLLNEKLPRVLALGSALQRDLIVLPEHIVYGYEDQPPVNAPHLDPDITVVLGGQRDTAEGSFQTMYAWDGKWTYADKLRLVIFGEYVPFRDKLKFLEGFNLPQGDMRPADKITTLKLQNIKVGGLICFEGLFEEVARKHASNGAHVLALSAIDDWYQGTGAIEALKAGAVLRAVENRLPLVKSSPLGPSFVVDALGRIKAETKVGTTEIARAEVVVGPSYVSPIRHIFPWLCLLTWPLVILSANWPSRKPTSAQAQTNSNDPAIDPQTPHLEGKPLYEHE